MKADLPTFSMRGNFRPENSFTLFLWNVNFIHAAYCIPTNNPTCLFMCILTTLISLSINQSIYLSMMISNSIITRWGQAVCALGSQSTMGEAFIKNEYSIRCVFERGLNANELYFVFTRDALRSQCAHRLRWGSIFRGSAIVDL